MKIRSSTHSHPASRPKLARHLILVIIRWARHSAAHRLHIGNKTTIPEHCIVVVGPPLPNRTLADRSIRFLPVFPRHYFISVRIAPCSAAVFPFSCRTVADRCLVHECFSTLDCIVLVRDRRLLVSELPPHVGRRQKGRISWRGEWTVPCQGWLVGR